MAAVQRGIAAGQIAKPGAVMTKAAAEQDDCGSVGAQAVDAAAGAVVDAEQARLDAARAFRSRRRASQRWQASLGMISIIAALSTAAGVVSRRGGMRAAFLFRWFRCGAVAAAKIRVHRSV